MKTPIQIAARGVQASVACGPDDTIVVAFKEPGLGRLRVKRVSRLDAEKPTSVPLDRQEDGSLGIVVVAPEDGDNTFPKFGRLRGAVWLVYRAWRDGVWQAVAREVLVDGLGPERWFGYASGNHPVVMSEDGLVAWQSDVDTAVHGFSIDHGPRPFIRRDYKPDGLSHLDGDRPVFVAENRDSVAGVLNPVRAGGCIVGEDERGLVAVIGDRRGIVLDGECMTPRVDTFGNGRFAAATWGTPGVRVVLFSAEDLDEEVEVPEEPPVVQTWPRKLWFLPYYSHGRYGDTPIADHVGNAILLTEQEGDPEMLPRDIARVAPLGLPLVVQGMNPSAEAMVNPTVAWWAGGVLHPRGEHVTLPEQVARCLERPEKPVIALLDQTKWPPTAHDWPEARPSWITDRVWPTVQAYRDPGESFRTFNERVTSMLERVKRYGVWMGLEVSFYDRNGELPITDLLECMPLYERWIRDYPICAVLEFSDRRPGGMVTHPKVRAWAKAFLAANPTRPSRDDYWTPDSGDVDAGLINKISQTHDAMGGVLAQLSAREKARLLALLKGSDNGGGGDDEEEPGGDVVYRDFGDHVARRWVELRGPEKTAEVVRELGHSMEELDRIFDPKDPNYDEHRAHQYEERFKAVQCPIVVRIASELHHLSDCEDVGLSRKDGGNNWTLPDGSKVATDIIAMRPTRHGKVVPGEHMIVDVLVAGGGHRTTATWNPKEINSNPARPWAEPPLP